MLLPRTHGTHDAGRDEFAERPFRQGDAMRWASGMAVPCRTEREVLLYQWSQRDPNKPTEKERAKARRQAARKLGARK